MPATVSITEEQVYTAFRAFLLGILPAGVEVILGQVNRVPQPLVQDFVVFTPILRRRLSMTSTVYNDGHPSGPQNRADLSKVELVLQVDVHGPAAPDNAHIIATLWSSDVAVQAFRAAEIDAAPLTNTDPRQQPFVNGEQQVETRWTLDASIQVDSVVTTAQDFAASLAVQTINVDATYPPA